MKNQRTLLLYMLTLLLSAITVPSDAQQRQDALYIYRNDGEFNAFFYGDIQRICYSKIDTLGVEHDDFVVQEVWALDSVYRIPVDAIDSVAFVTPETKVKADVFCPDKSIADYIIGSDSVWWIRLAPNTPQELIPQMDQKLLIAEGSKYIPNGFGGKVAYVEHQSEGWLIITEDVELPDIYDRLLLKAAAADPGASAARRYGPLDGTELSIVDEEPWELGSYNEEFTLKNSHQLTPDSSPIAVTADLTGDVKANFNAYLNSFRAFIFYDVQYGLKADIKTEMSYDGKIELALGGGLTGRLEAGYKVEKNVEGVKVDLGCGIYAEGSFSGFKFSWEKEVGGTVNTFMAIDEKDPFTTKLRPSSTPTFRYHVAPKPGSGSSSFEFMNQASFGMGLYAKAEIEAAIPLKKGKITDFVKHYLKKYVENDTLKLLSFEFGVDLGGKIEFKFPTSLLAELGISASSLIDKFDPKWPTLMDTQDIYSRLDKETGVKFSAADKIGGSMSMGEHWSIEWPIINEDVESSSYGIVPTLGHVTVGPDEDDQPVKPWIHKITAGIRRNLIVPGVKIGFVVTDRDNENEIVTKNSSLNYYSEDIFQHGNLMHFKNNTYNLTFDDIDPKKDEPANYTAYPLVVWMGGEMLGDTKRDFTLDPANFDIEDREPVIFVNDYEDNEYPLVVKPNMKKVEIEPKAKWLKEPYHDYRNNKILVSWEELPDSVEERKGTILLRGLSSKTDEVLVEDSIVVTLVRGILELSSDSLIFDLKGGVGSIEITRTNLKDFEVLVDANEKWLRGSVHENYITMTVDESDEDYRAALVYVRGYTPNGKSVMRAFWVRQHPAEGIPSLSPKTMTFFLEGGKQTAFFSKANYPYSGVFVSDEGKKWAHAEMDSKGVVTVTVDATKDEQGRSCTVVCWASNKPDPKESEMVQLPIAVSQRKPADFIIEEVDFGVWSRGKWVDAKDKEHTDYFSSNHHFVAWNDENVEITCFENGNDVHVECSGIDNTSDFTKNYRATLSFDIENFKDKSKVKITNLIFNQTPISTSGYYRETRADVTNIPVTEYDDDYIDPLNLPDHLPLYIEADASIENGVIFNSWNYRDDTTTYQYVSSPYNKVIISIDINPWGDLIEIPGDDDDDDDWGDWSRSTVKQAKQKRVHSALERRLLQQVKKIKKQ